MNAVGTLLLFKLTEQMKMFSLTAFISYVLSSEEPCPLEELYRPGNKMGVVTLGLPISILVTAFTTLIRMCDAQKN